MKVNRVIGKYRGEKEGPLVVVTAGVHGNEPSGVEALQRVFLELERTKPKMAGKIIGIAGNVAALKKNVRFIDEDLNRTWTKEKLAKTQHQTHEEREMQEIIEVIEKFSSKNPPLQTAHSPRRYFLDCHSTSSESLPYISVQDVGENNTWAHRFPVYIVKGFSDIVHGSIDHYFSDQGMTGFAFEAGQHADENTSRYHEALIWSVLKEANNLSLEELNCYPECVAIFEKNPRIAQKTFDIIYRHGIVKKDHFVMKPGFDNFQKITKGELLAVQNGEEIRSTWDTEIFMPLYQPQGDDGFFVVKEVAEKA